MPEVTIIIVGEEEWRTDTKTDKKRLLYRRV